MPREAALAVTDAPGVKRGTDGVPSIGAIRHDGRRGNIVLVGSTAGIDRMQPDLHIVEGRSYRPAVHISADRRAARIPGGLSEVPEGAHG